MKDKETGLQYKTKFAVEKYIAEVIIKNNPKYTFNQALIDSGYTARYAQSHYNEMWRKVEIQSLITKAKANLEAKTAIKDDLTVDKVLQNIQYGLNLAKERNNLTAIARFVELQGRYLAMFTDNVNTTNTIRQRELDEKAAAEAAELGRLRLANKYSLHLPPGGIAQGLVLMSDNTTDNQSEGQRGALPSIVKAG